MHAHPVRPASLPFSAKLMKEEFRY